MVPCLAKPKKNLQAIYALNTISTIHPSLTPSTWPGKSRGRSGVNNHPSPTPQNRWILNGELRSKVLLGCLGTEVRINGQDQWVFRTYL